MSARLEYKYLVPNSQLARVRAAMLPYVQTDPFAENPGLKEYTVRSIYYDTPHASCYHEKLAGIEMRQKYRIRGYNQPTAESIVFLEIKRKRGSLISKTRAPLLRSALESFLADPDIDQAIIGAAESRDDARRFLYHYYRQNLRPAALVVYDREAFFGKFDPTLRLTFDKRIRGTLRPGLSQLYDEGRLWNAMAQYVVFEVKFFRGALPVWISRIIKDYSLPRMALSKYAMCLDSGHAQWGPEHVQRLVAASGYLTA